MAAFVPETLGEIERTEPVFVRPRAIAATKGAKAAVMHVSESTGIVEFVDGSLEATAYAHPLRDQSALATLTNAIGFVDFVPPGRPRHADSAAVDPSTGHVLVAHDIAWPGPETAPDAATAGGYGDVAQGIDVTKPVEVRITRVEPDSLAQESTGFDGKFLAITDPSSGLFVWQLVQGASDIAHHPTHHLAMVSGLTTDTVLLVDTSAPDPMSRCIGIARVGRAPVGVAFDADGRHAYVLNGQGFSVSRIDVSPAVDGSEDLEEGMPVDIAHEAEAVFAADPLPAELRAGRRLFTYAWNADTNGTGALACASCHRNGAEDQTVWFVAGIPRQTPALAGRVADSAPYSWTGKNSTLAANIKETIQRMGGDGLEWTDLDSLEDFVREGLESPPNPYLSPAGLDATQLAGKAIFEDPAVGCAGCHVPPSFASPVAFDVGTASEPEVEEAELDAKAGGYWPPEPILFNTPSLRGVWMTGPYLHDGSALTLYSVLEATLGTMGNVALLDESEKEALVAYLLTL